MKNGGCLSFEKKRSRKFESHGNWPEVPQIAVPSAGCITRSVEVFNTCSRLTVILPVGKNGYGATVFTFCQMRIYSMHFSISLLPSLSAFADIFREIFRCAFASARSNGEYSPSPVLM